MFRKFRKYGGRLAVLCLLPLALHVSAESVTVRLQPKGEHDRTAELKAAIEKVRKAGGGNIYLASGDYWLRSPIESGVWVSNHDNPRPRKIFLPIEGVTNLTIFCYKGEKGARLLADGNGICAAFIDTKNVRVSGVAFDYVRPFFSIWHLKGGKLVGDKKHYPYEVKDGKIFATGTGWREKQTICEIFDKGGAFRQSVWWDGSSDRVFGGHPDGAIAMTRSPYRPNPCVFVYRSERIGFVSCGAYAAAGMGFLAQRSKDIALNGWRTRGERLLALQADATHFSNCAGKIIVTDSTFEGMVDDAINVHSTSLKIVEKKDDKTIVCRYMHHQSVGFEVFKPGETLRFIRGATLEPGAEVKVESVKMLAKDKVEIRYSTVQPSTSNLQPADYGVGDAVENADWQPSVTFRKNIVRNSTPRATLFTTPGKVVCEDNLFENVAGQPIYLAGDAWDWYESGACQDVLVRSNRFVHCGFKSGRGMIQIEPAVHDLKQQKKRYHRNIRVEDNVFNDFKIPLVWARSADGVVVRNNTIIDGNEKAVVDRESADIKVEENTLLKEGISL